ncbi:MAG: peptidase, partial [Candidatus Aenigmarchaeota archaeon]|nr:peptidase [Candidatus Aenigmarchaeota archaeon]
MKMYMVMMALFAVVYSLVSVAGMYLGMGTFVFYAILATVFMSVQYMVGPKVVEWSMKVKYVSQSE